MNLNLVPTMPTPEMCHAAEAELDADSNWPTIWAAMLKSAPTLTTTESSQAIIDVLVERRRQVEAEGWTPEHDDQHMPGALGRAAGFYALNAGAAMWFGTTDTSICDTAPDGWPWEPGWWKPTNARRDLVRSAALILAEIERMDRAEAKKQGANHGE